MARRENNDEGLPQTVDTSPGAGIQRRWGDLGTKPDSQVADVATPSATWMRMVPKWQMISTVLGGTSAMRAAGKSYLPSHQYESEEAYAERRQRATLKNYTGRTLDNLTSKAFRDAPRLGDDVPSGVKDLAEDIDAEGAGLNVFARAWFRLAVERGFAFVLVDYSRHEFLDGRARTLEDDRTEGVRPFWRLIDPLDLLHIRIAKVGARVQVIEARIREWEVVHTGWQDSYVERVRVLRPGYFEVHEKRVTKEKVKPQWVVIDQGTMDLDYVPLVAFYTDKAGVAESKPPLEDLAYLNVEHFQSSSDQQAILTVARFPILAVSGAAGVGPNDKPVTIGPKQWISVPDPQGRIYYVEHAGNAIAAGRTDLEDIEDQMASYGSEFLRKRPGASSATGRALDSAEAISSLMAWGMDFKDALEIALQYTADWLKLGPKSGGTVVYAIKPDVSIGESKELDILDKARERKDISRVSYLNELVRREILATDFNEQVDLALLDKEPVPDNPGFEAIIKTGEASNKKEGGSIPEKPGPSRTTGDPPVIIGQ